MARVGHPGQESSAPLLVGPRHVGTYTAVFMLHQGLGSREAPIQAPARSSPCGSSMAASTRPEQHAANSATERQGHDTSRRRRRPLLWGSKRSVVLGALVMAAVAAKAVGGRGASSCSRLATAGLVGKAGATGAWHSSRQQVSQQALPQWPISCSCSCLSAACLPVLWRPSLSALLLVPVLHGV